jgi:type IV pilus assembly protein PilY1
VSYVFAGDLHGKLWNLDFTGVGASGWTAGQLSRFSTGSGSNLVAFPMYIAKDGNGNVQPITAAPTILQGYGGPTTHFVGFGTGKYIEGTDSSSTAQQTYYVLYDNGRGGGAGGASGVAGIAGRGRLQQVTSDAAGNLSPSAAFTWGRATRDADVTQRSGWFYDLGSTGERVVYDSVYVPLTTKVTFSSLIPDAATSPGVCSVSGGSGNIYYVDMVEGKGFKKASTVGVPGGPMPLFNDETTTTSKADGSGRRLRTRPILLGVPGAAGFGLGSEVNDVLPVGRLSWRQINNYLELKNR